MSSSIVATAAGSPFGVATGAGKATPARVAIGQTVSARDDGGTVSISAEGLRLSASGAAGDQAGANTPGGSYDFTHMSQQALQGAMRDLFQSGKMSFDEISLAVPLVQTSLAKADVAAATPSPAAAPMDFLSTLSAGFDAANARGDADGAKNIARLMSALGRVQGTPIAS